MSTDTPAFLESLRRRRLRLLGLVKHFLCVLCPAEADILGQLVAGELARRLCQELHLLHGVARGLDYRLSLVVSLGRRGGAHGCADGDVVLSVVELADAVGLDGALKDRQVVDLHRVPGTSSTSGSQQPNCHDFVMSTR